MSLFIALLFLSCDKKSEPPASRTSSSTSDFYLPFDTFDTGSGTYVRSLAVEGPYLWVGTSLGALKIQRTSGVLLQTFTQKEGLKSPYIFTISTSKEGTKWFGTNAGGLSRLDRNETWQTFMPPELADSWVYQIAFQRGGIMWIGTWNGVSRFDGKSFTNYRVRDGLANPWVYAVAVDLDDSVWFGSEGGVNRYNGQIWQTWTHKDGLGADNLLGLRPGAGMHNGSENLSDLQKSLHRHNLDTLDDRGEETYNENYVFSLYIDSRGTKWIGTWGGGLSRFDGRVWKNFTTREGLSGNVVYAVSPDHSGGIWIGTNHGISHFDGARFSNLPRQADLPHDDIYALVEDEDGILWSGHKEGVTRFFPKSRLANYPPAGTAPDRGEK